MGDAVGGTACDFFVSYAQADQPWAEWVAWQLKEAGYRVVLSAWDLVPGDNKPAWTHRSVEGARHVLALVSASYLDPERGPVDWTAAHGYDPHSLTRRLIPLRIDDTRLPGTFRPLVSVDLFGVHADEARELLLKKIEAVQSGHSRPTAPPAFPPDVRPQPSGSAPPFPGNTRRAAVVTGSPPPRSPGQPVALLDDPVDFGVHTAVEIGTPPAGLPTLPTYVPRDHDGRLQAVVRKAVDGASAVVVLVGDSSCGKSRACWEAVRSLPDGWRLWHPISPDPPRARKPLSVKHLQHNSPNRACRPKNPWHPWHCWHSWHPCLSLRI